MLSLLSWAIAQSPQRLEAWAVRFGDGGCGVLERLRLRRFAAARRS